MKFLKRFNPTELAIAQDSIIALERSFLINNTEDFIERLEKFGFLLFLLPKNNLYIRQNLLLATLNFIKNGDYAKFLFKSDSSMDAYTGTFYREGFSYLKYVI